MSIVQNFSSPFIIRTVNPSDPVYIDTKDTIVTGNLTILGTGSKTVINTVDTNVLDNIITLNAGYAIDPPSPALNSGFEVYRGPNRPVMRLIWNEGALNNNQKWQITEETYNGVTYGTAVYSLTHYNPSTGFNMTNVNSDLSPKLGGPLDTGYFNIFSSNVGDGTNTWKANVQINSNLALQKFTSTVTSVTPNHITLTASNVSSGGTGLYVTADEQGIAHEELISKKRAIVYSIIF